MDPTAESAIDARIAGVVAPASDIVAAYLKEMMALMVEFGDRVLDVVGDAKRVDVEDVREAMLGPMRRRAAQLCDICEGRTSQGADAGHGAGRASSTLPVRGTAAAHRVDDSSGQ